MATTRVRKIKGRKRQAMVDMDGHTPELDPQPADVRDGDCAIPVLRRLRRSFPFVAKAFADMGHSGDRPQNATLVDDEIVRKWHLENFKRSKKIKPLKF